MRQESEMAAEEMQPQLRKLVDLVKSSKVTMVAGEERGGEGTGEGEGRGEGTRERREGWS